MKQKKTRPAAENPAIQNLRKYLKEYLESDARHTPKGFALKLGKTSRELGRYFRGESNPRQKLVEFWAEQFGVSYDEMMTADFEYIDYPLSHDKAPHRGGRHITKKEVRTHYEAMEEEVRCLACEDFDVEELRKRVLAIIDRHKM